MIMKTIYKLLSSKLILEKFINQEMHCFPKYLPILIKKKVLFSVVVDSE